MALIQLIPGASPLGKRDGVCTIPTANGLRLTKAQKHTPPPTERQKVVRACFAAAARDYTPGTSAMEKAGWESLSGGAATGITAYTGRQLIRTQPGGLIEPDPDGNTGAGFGLGVGLCTWEPPNVVIRCNPDPTAQDGTLASIYIGHPQSIGWSVPRPWHRLAATYYWPALIDGCPVLTIPSPWADSDLTGAQVKVDVLSPGQELLYQIGTIMPPNPAPSVVRIPNYAPGFWTLAPDAQPGTGSEWNGAFYKPTGMSGPNWGNGGAGTLNGAGLGIALLTNFPIDDPFPGSEIEIVVDGPGAAPRVVWIGEAIDGGADWLCYEWTGVGSDARPHLLLVGDPP